MKINWKNVREIVLWMLGKDFWEFIFEKDANNLIIDLEEEISDAKNDPDALVSL